jgi:uncharacterized membrane protein
MSALASQQVESGGAERAPGNLPRMLYVGDVAVESTVAGSTLLYRLLQNYPADRLRVAEGNISSSQPDKRLPGVIYDEFKVGNRRLLHTRLHDLYSGVLHLTAPARAARLRKICRDFRPEAVLTVAHGYSWLTAARLSVKACLPLHLIVHDDCASAQKSVLPAVIHKRLDRDFGEVYRHAAARFCASPYMAEAFAERYGAAGTVLYPSRAADVPEHTGLPHRRDAGDSLVFAFAGTVNTRGYAQSLATLASVLGGAGAKLIVYSNLDAGGVGDCGLEGSHVSVRPVVPFGELFEGLRRDADVLFVPMSFAAEDAPNMRAGFPSKIADYTAVGVPLLIWGPPYCSAVRWARENSGVAEVVDEPSAAALRISVTRLMRDAQYRRSLAEAALHKGREFFAHDAAVEKFQRLIARSAPGRNDSVSGWDS